VVPELLRAGHEVIGLDTGFYRKRMLCRTGENNPMTVVKKLRRVEVRDFEGLDAVVDEPRPPRLRLAEL
jgi:hypothetical protein